MIGAKKTIQSIMIGKLATMMRSYAMLLVLLWLIGSPVGIAFAQVAVRGTRTITSMTGSSRTSSVFSDRKAGATDGLQIEIHPPCVNEPGYLRWTCIVSNVNGMPFDADRELELRFYNSYYVNGSCTVHPMQLTQGSTSAKAEFLVPRWAMCFYWSCTVHKDGYELRGLRAEHQYDGNQMTGTRRCSLVVGMEQNFDNRAYVEGSAGLLKAFFGEFPNLEQWNVEIHGWGPSDPNATQTNVVTTPGFPGTFPGNGASGWAFAYETRIPENWLELARFTWIWIPEPALANLKEGQIKAIRRYIQSGGVLAVTQSSDDAESNKRIQRISREEFEWTWSNWVTKDKSVLSWSQKRHGMGMIVRSTQTDMQIAPEYLTTLDNSIAIPAAWETIRGLSDGSNAGSNYWNWLIPQVGVPPVWSFVVLVGLFAGLAGPSLLWFTNRARRPSWLLFLFPGLALLATGLITLYAIFHDGFSTQSRTRSITYYDAIHEEGSVWNRQTFFSGAPPRIGLRYNEETEITPFSYVNDYDGFRQSGHDQIRWEGGEQRYAGFLGAREQRQVLTRYPLVNLKPFQVELNEKLTVKNQMAENWKVAIFIDGDRSWMGKNILEGKSLELEPCSFDDFCKVVQENNVELKIPEGMIQGQYGSILDWDSSNRFMSWTSFDPWMERQLKQWSSELHWEKNREMFPTRGFILILDKGSYLQKPIVADDSESFHMMVGEW